MTGGGDPRTPAVAMSERSQAFLTSLLDGDDDGATMTIAEALHADVALDLVIEQIIRPALGAVGRAWEHGELSIADEHMASEVTAAVLHRFTPPRGSDERALSAVVACVPGEQHALGAQAFTAVLRERGWDVVLLGASVPAEALAVFVALRHPALVVLSAKTAGRVPDALAAIAAVRAVDAAATILVGGDAVGASTSKLGADHADADLSSAVEWLGRTFAS